MSTFPRSSGNNRFLRYSRHRAGGNTRWLVKSFMAAVVVPNTTLLPLLCIVMLPAWLLLAGKPMMMVNRPKQQPPHDNV